MKTVFLIIGAIVSVLFCACARIPFKNVDFRPVSHLNTNKVSEDFCQILPPVFEVMESAVYIYKGHEFTGLFYTRVSEKEDTVELVGFSPLGMKFLQIQSSGDETEYSFNIPQVTERVDGRIIAEAITTDIRRIYFERVPPESAYVRKGKEKIFFVQKKGAGRLEWVFGGPENRLFQKHYFKGKREIWSVRYFGYKVKGIYVYPSKIYFENYDQKHQLVIRLKEILE